MSKRWIGPLVTALIVGGVAFILVANLNRSRPSPESEAQVEPPANPVPPPALEKPRGFREYPIGDEVVKNHMRIAAVWLPPVQMEGMADMTGPAVIHLEADVRATAENPNGFALNEFVPYLKIAYTITSASDGAPAPAQRGELSPMVARDGLHYGASVALPKAGKYRLTYALQPPSAGGLGRHSDPVTGVAAWWQPFEVGFDWDYPGPPRAP